MGPPLEASATVSATCGSSRGKDEQPSSKRRRKSTDDTPIANTAAAAAPVDGSCAGAAGEMEGGEDGQKNEIRSMGEAENDQESKIGEVDMEENMEEQAAGKSESWKGRERCRGCFACSACMYHGMAGLYPVQRCEHEGRGYKF